MNRALRYLLVRLTFNRVCRFVRDLRRPSRSLGLLLWLSLIVILVWSIMRGESAGDMDGGVILTFYLSFILLVSVVIGVSQRGVAFRPADVDFLFPGPFARYQLLIYRLVSLWAVSLISAAVILLFIGRYVPNPALAYASVLLCQLVATNLQVLVGLLSTRISERVFARLRRPLQIASVLLGLIPLAVLMVLVLANAGGWRGIVESALASPVARIGFYPALAAGKLATATTFAAASSPLLGLVACLVGSLLLVLILPIDFFESSTTTSVRVAQALSRARRGLSATSLESRARRLDIPTWSIFRGAGALAWKNLHVAGRSLRTLFVAVVFGVGILLPIIVSRRIDPSGPTSLAAYTGVIGIGLLPLFLQIYLAFDFRRDAPSMADLKTLPMSPSALAAGEVATPVFIATAIQLVLLLGYSIARGVPPWVVGVALLTYPSLSLGIMLIGNLFFLLMPTPSSTDSARPSMGGMAGGMILSWLALAVALTPAAFVGWWVLGMTESFWLAFALAVGIQYLVDLLLLLLVGKCFERFDVAHELV